MASRSGSSTREGGFTLVEAVVAMGVFALAAVAIIELSAENVSAQRFARDATLAGIVAQNQLVIAMTSEENSQLGETEGEEVQAGRAWAWVLTVSETEDITIHQLDVVVTDAADGRQAAAVTAFRMAL